MSIGSLDINQCIFPDDEKAVTNLLESAKFGYKSPTENLLSKGVSPNCTDDNGCTPLHHAASQSQIEIIPILISHKKIILEKLRCTKLPRKTK